MAEARSIVALALDKLPTPMRAEVANVAYMSAAGWQTMEIAGALHMTWHRVNELKDAASVAVVGALRDQGYSDVEIIRTLGVPTQRVTG